MEDTDMLALFSMIPLDKGAHFSPYVARITKIIQDSGLPNELNAMSTVVEGSWDEVMDLINRCRLELRKDSERVSIKIWIDDKADSDDMLHRKIESVKEKMGDY
jgi:uncharacterized protein (TIGR00106 family)